MASRKSSRRSWRSPSQPSKRKRSSRSWPTQRREKSWRWPAVLNHPGENRKQSWQGSPPSLGHQNKPASQRGGAGRPARHCYSASRWPSLPFRCSWPTRRLPTAAPCSLPPLSWTPMLHCPRATAFFPSPLPERSASARLFHTAGRGAQAGLVLLDFCRFRYPLG